MSGFRARISPIAARPLRHSDISSKFEFVCKSKESLSLTSDPSLANTKLTVFDKLGIPASLAVSNLACAMRLHNVSIGMYSNENSQRRALRVTRRLPAWYRSAEAVEQITYFCVAHLVEIAVPVSN